MFTACHSKSNVCILFLSVKLMQALLSYLSVFIAMRQCLRTLFRGLCHVNNIKNNYRVLYFSNNLYRGCTLRF